MANPRSPFLGKGSMHPFIHLSIGFWLYTALQCRSSMSSNCLVFHTSGGISSSPAAFLFLIFLRTESSSSCVNGPSLISNCLLIILVIGSCVIFGGFPSKFSKCCFHSFILSCWFAAFSFALAVIFFPVGLLLSGFFLVCYNHYYCLCKGRVPVKLKTFVSCKVIKSRSGEEKKNKKQKRIKWGGDINARTHVLRNQVKSQRNGKLATIVPLSKNDQPKR